MKLGHTFWSPNTGLIWVLQQLIPTIHLYEEEVWQRFGRWILGHNYFMYTYTVWHRYQSQLSTCTCTVHQTFTLHGLCLATNTHTYTHTYIRIHSCMCFLSSKEEIESGNSIHVYECFRVPMDCSFARPLVWTLYWWNSSQNVTCIHILHVSWYKVVN